MEGYDGDLNTMCVSFAINNNKRMNVDSSIWNKKMYIYMKIHWNNGYNTIYFYDKENKLLNSNKIGNTGSYRVWRNVDVPENTSYMIIIASVNGRNI